MAKILVVYHSIYGHVRLMAQAIARGAGEIDGSVVTIRKIPETMSEASLAALGARDDDPTEVAKPEDLARFDAIIFGTPTRFGNMSGQMRTFLDQTGGLWMAGALIGKLGSVFTSSATQHGGQESTLLSFHTTLLHHGMLIVGLPYSEVRQMGHDQVEGGSPYGASTIAGTKGERLPSERELGMAQFQGRHVSSLAARLAD